MLLVQQSQAARLLDEEPIEAMPPLKRLVQQNAFQIFIVLCILLNTVTLAMDKYPAVEEEERILVRQHYYQVRRRPRASSAKPHHPQAI